MAALVNASDYDCRLVISLLMNGTNADEALKVQWADVDLSQGVIRVPGASKRNIALNAATAHLIAARSKGADSSFLVGTTDQPVTRDSIDAQILRRPRRGPQRCHASQLRLPAPYLRGIPRASGHAFRRPRATGRADAGGYARHV